ncbi:hypothetical protein LRS06_21105 [Hymenobacter sp. J193]|uniref:hypothetical protein n=1 Tax=Hymenobacter sp. J193 TaxID=2898429 RepID=UPI00215198AF|nr:hypothetical protein [Hymenobacter sp. J193]MCR5886202.1 hypothetical protein [Hymenobacter sp. J193]MCR5890228.1 hypothetical protein [Hymenobacter sp. J193]
MRAQTTDSTQTAKPELNTAPPAPTRQPATPAPVYTPAEPTPRASEDIPAPQPGTRPEVQAPQVPRKFFLYSNFGLGYSNSGGFGSQFNFSLSPAIGYRVSDRFSIGPGVSYAYNNYGLERGYVQQGFPKNISTNSYGVKVFAQYRVIDQFFAHGEYEVTFAETTPETIYLGGPYTEKHTVSTPLLGAGYRQQFGDRAAGDILLLYNFNDGLYKVYGQPVIRFCFLFDLK